MYDGLRSNSLTNDLRKKVPIKKKISVKHYYSVLALISKHTFFIAICFLQTTSSSQVKSLAQFLEKFLTFIVLRHRQRILKLFYWM